MEMKEFVDQVNKDVASIKADIDKRLEKVDGLIEKANEAAKMSAAEEGKRVETDLRNEIKAESAKIEELDKALQKLQFGGGSPKQKNHIAEMFEDAGVKAFFASGGKKTAAFDIAGPTFGKATLTPADNWTNDVVAPDRMAPIFYDPDRAEHIRDIMVTSPTSSSTIHYVEESGITDGTGMVLPGGTKPNSVVSHEQKSVPVRKIATELTMATEMLDDLPAFRGYLVQRFAKKIKIKEDQQLLFGTGLTNQLVGIAGVAQAYVDVLADAKVNRYDVLRAAITQARVDEYRANYVVLHPNDVLYMTLAKATDGQYVFPWFLNQPLRIGNVPIFETTAITEGYFLVGDFAQGATLFDRMQASVAFSTEHDQNFTKNLVTVVFEERLANVVHRPNAFVFGSFAMGLASGSA